MFSLPRISSLAGLLLLTACTTMPSGPSALVLPGTGKNFDQFRFDDFDCRQYAQGQLGGTTPGYAADDSGARTALLGTLLGAAAGAAINGGRGAGVGAGAGLALGGLAGTGAAQSAGYTIQQRYDIGYQQCMYAKGHRIPSAGTFRESYQARSYPTPPPPPPGTPPGPPPR